MLIDLNYTLDGFHIVISFGLAVSVFGLWIRKRFGLIVSGLGLLSILATYGNWHVRTKNYLNRLEVTGPLYQRIEQQTGFFQGATTWDLVVLVFVGFSLCWHLKSLIRKPSSQHILGEDARLDQDTNAEG